MSVRGIDVSAYQSETPPLAGKAFCFVKATEGTSYVNPKQLPQARYARRHGVLVGWYHFLRPGDMKAQAAYFVEKCGSVHGEPLWADWEDPDVSCHDKDTFLREVARLRGDDHRVGLYCSQDFWLHRDTTSECGDALWIANYNGHPGAPGIEHKWLFHQYTSDPIDTSLAAFGSTADLRAWAKKETDDMPSVDEIVRALAKTDGVFDVGDKMKRSQPKNEEWQLESILAFIGDRTVDNMDALRAMAAQVGALRGTLDKVVDKLGDGGLTAAEVQAAAEEGARSALEQLGERLVDDSDTTA